MSSGPRARATMLINAALCCHAGLEWFGVLVNGAVLACRTEIIKVLVFEAGFGNDGFTYVDRSFAVSPREPAECWENGMNATNWDSYATNSSWTGSRGWDCAPCRYFSKYGDCPSTRMSLPLNAHEPAFYLVSRVFTLLILPCVL